MALFDRLYTTSYQCAIVSTALSCTFIELFDVEECQYVLILIERSLVAIGNDTIW